VVKRLAIQGDYGAASTRAGCSASSRFEFRGTLAQRLAIQDGYGSACTHTTRWGALKRSLLYADVNGVYYPE